MKIIALLTFLISSTLLADVPNYLKKCSLRVSNNLYISFDITKCSFNDGSDRCVGSLNYDSFLLGGNSCDSKGGCTQVGVSDLKVLFKLTKKNKLKIIDVIGDDYSYFSGFESSLYRKLFLKFKFKFENDSVYFKRRFKKLKMNCD